METKAVDRVAELEAELERRDAKIKELTTERDEASELVDRQREHVEETNRMIERWIEAFDMHEDEPGTWSFDREQSEFFQHYEVLWNENQRLVRQWNKFVPEYNAVIRSRERGRPLAASKAQQDDVVRRRKTGSSLRAIAAATSLSPRTVCTIIEKAKGQGRTAKRTNDVRRKVFDRLRAAEYRAKKRIREGLPQQIDEQLKTGAALVKAAKGLGR